MNATDFVTWAESHDWVVEEALDARITAVGTVFSRGFVRRVWRRWTDGTWRIESTVEVSRYDTVSPTVQTDDGGRKEEMQAKYGMGATVEDAFLDAVKTEKSREGGIGQMHQRPNRVKAQKFVDDFEGSTDGKWDVVDASYTESRDHKLSVGMQKQRGKVWLFFKTG